MTLVAPPLVFQFNHFVCSPGVSRRFAITSYSASLPNLSVRRCFRCAIGESGSRTGFGYGARLGIPEVFVPAGFADSVFDASFVLSEDGTKYEGKLNSEPTRLGGVGLRGSVKIAHRDDKTIPRGTLSELLSSTDLLNVCFSAMLAEKVPQLHVGDLVLYTTMPELVAANKPTAAGTIIAKVMPHYSPKGGWQAGKLKPFSRPQRPAPTTACALREP
jgi:hypothetical protein